MASFCLQHILGLKKQQLCPAAVSYEKHTYCSHCVGAMLALPVQPVVS